MFRRFLSRPLVRPICNLEHLSRRNVFSQNTAPSGNNTGLKALAIGGTAGVLGSWAGMGGGFVVIPLLTRLGVSQHAAHGTSLTVVTASGLAGAMAYWDYVNWEAAAAIASTGIFSATLGVSVASRLSEVALRRALGALMICMGPAVPMKEYFEEYFGNPSGTLDEKRTTETHQGQSVDMLIAPACIGVGSGFLSGLFGVGGGTLVVPALTYFYTFENAESTHLQALATSLAAMTLPAVVGTVRHASKGNVVTALVGPLVLGSLVGARTGGAVASEYIPENTLRWGFSVLLTVLGVRTLFK